MHVTHIMPCFDPTRQFNKFEKDTREQIDSDSLQQAFTREFFSSAEAYMKFLVREK
jgi:hypothetical protein